MQKFSNKSQDLIVLSIDLGGKNDEICVRSNDTPMNLAKEFSLKHNLSTEVESSICQYISLNLSKIFETPRGFKSATPHCSSASIPEETPQRKKLTRGHSNNITHSSRGISLEKTMESFKKSKEIPKGERFYYKSIKNLKSKEIQISKILAEKEAAEMQGITFRPTINSSTVLRTHSRPEVDLLMRDKVVKEKLEKKRQESAEKELKDCTFRPKVNKNSARIDKVRIKDRNSYLYQFSKKTTEEVGTSPERKGFLNQTLREKGKERVNVAETVERLMLHQKKCEISLDKARERKLESEKVDPITGQELFRPQIISNPRMDREKSIWEELYSYKKRPIANSPPTMRLIDKNSEKITGKIRYRRYDEIFKSLQPTNGKIQYKTIEFTIVDMQLIDIISPLVEELRESKQALDFKQFCEAMDALLKVLTPQEKWYIMFVNKSPVENLATQASNNLTYISKKG